MYNMAKPIITLTLFVLGGEQQDLAWKYLLWQREVIQTPPVRSWYQNDWCSAQFPTSFQYFGPFKKEKILETGNFKDLNTCVKEEKHNKELTRKKKWIVITSEKSITTKKQPNLGRLRSFITALKAHLESSTRKLLSY